jgi:hypothetical protein
MSKGILKIKTSKRKTINNDIINSVVKEEKAKKNKLHSNILGALNGKSNVFKNIVMSKYNRYYTNGEFNRFLRRTIRKKSGMPESREVRFNTLPNTTKKMIRKRVNAMNNVTKSNNNTRIPDRGSIQENRSLNGSNVATQGNNTSLNQPQENLSLNAPNVEIQYRSTQGNLSLNTPNVEIQGNNTTNISLNAPQGTRF